MVENKKKRTLTISTTFDKKKLGEPSFRRGEKKVFVPEKVYQISFMKLFFNYIKNAKYVLCNASSLSISLSFLIRKYIYLPSRTGEYKKMDINKLFDHPFYSNFF